MEIRSSLFDHGNAFDFGKTSDDYAKYRDIYPQHFYDKIVERGLCIEGQRALDLGTGTGVLPRNLYRYGAVWTGVDLSENQIEQAVSLSEAAHMRISYEAVAAEDVDFPEQTFDVITACQCFAYFDHERLLPKLAGMLKPDGKLLVLYMAWLPYEDEIARASEEMVLRYNPQWTGAGYTRTPVWIPECAKQYFEITGRDEFDLGVPFTRETWHGRMKSCRGIGASLSQEEIGRWEIEHRKLLEEIAPDEFEILHFASLAELSVSG